MTLTFGILMIGRWLRRLAKQAAERRASSLHGLDARTLADIGIHPSEIASIEAESLGRVGLTRRRIVAGFGHV